MGNSFGKIFRVTTFGESHGPGMGCVIDGCPAGLSLDIEDIRLELKRRRPGPCPAHNTASSSRNEDDEPEILSGLFNGKTLGTPIAVLIRNKDHRPADYDELENVYRPGHADWTWEAKYGLRDHRGGGRSSGRETVSRIAAGAIAKKFLANYRIEIKAWTSGIAGFVFPLPGETGFDSDEIEKNPLRVPQKAGAEKAAEKLEQIKKDKDSAGCRISCRVTGLPAGLGEPVFDKLNAVLAKAILSIGAAKGIEFGSGFASADSLGSLENDSPQKSPSSAEEGPAFASNNSGGVSGGISSGMPLEFCVAFKPVPSIEKEQTTVDKNGSIKEIKIKGRHDVCIAGKAVPTVEAMTALVLADFMLQKNSNRIA